MAIIFYEDKDQRFAAAAALIERAVNGKSKGVTCRQDIQKELSRGVAKNVQRLIFIGHGSAGTIAAERSGAKGIMYGQLADDLPKFGPSACEVVVLTCFAADYVKGLELAMRAKLNGTKKSFGAVGVGNGKVVGRPLFELEELCADEDARAAHAKDMHMEGQAAEFGEVLARALQPPVYLSRMSVSVSAAAVAVATILREGYKSGESGVADVHTALSTLTVPTAVSDTGDEAVASMGRHVGDDFKPWPSEAELWPCDDGVAFDSYLSTLLSLNGFLFPGLITIPRARDDVRKERPLGSTRSRTHE